MIKALIFDFDGLVVDTEIVVYQVWQGIYRSYQHDLPLEKWLLCIGTDTSEFDPHEYLESLTGYKISGEEITRRRLDLDQLLAEKQPVLPGVENYLSEARRLGLRIGLASSSPRLWVARHLTRLGLLPYFEAMKCGDEVARVKPDPELYQAVLHQFGIRADEAIALEDSANGALAAKNAGMYCVVVPNSLTSYLSFDHADMCLSSLEELPLFDLIQRFEKRAVQG